MNTPKSLLLTYFIAATFTTISILVATRDISVGTDTANYADYFQNIYFYHVLGQLEPLFHNLTYGIRFFTESREIYFLAIFVIFNISFLYLFVRASSENKNIRNIFLFLGLLLSSNWYLVATTNGLRQGLSLPFTYLSILFLSQRKPLPSIIFAIISIGLHKSAVLVLPFILLTLLKDKIILYTFLTSSALYISGASEAIVKSLSTALGISLYSEIKGYGLDSGQWTGFQADFFVYSVFWGVFFYWAKKYIKPENVINYLNIWKMYCILIMPYFAFGFGGYSNRYAFIGWLFLPVIQSYSITSSTISDTPKKIISVAVFGFGIASYTIKLT